MHSAHLKPWTAEGVITLCSSHSCLTDPNSFVVVDILPFGSGASWLLTAGLFSGRCVLDSALCISLGDETGLQWEDYLFEMQNAVEWRMVMS